MTLVPAYSRDYKSGKDVLKDWNDGKDFKIADISSRWDGSYTSIRDSEAGKTYKIRYNRLADFVLIRDGKIVTA